MQKIKLSKIQVLTVIPVPKFYKKYLKGYRLSNFILKHLNLYDAASTATVWPIKAWREIVSKFIRYDYRGWQCSRVFSFFEELGQEPVHFAGFQIIRLIDRFLIFVVSLYFSGSGKQGERGRPAEEPPADWAKAEHTESAETRNDVSGKGNKFIDLVGAGRWKKG